MTQVQKIYQYEDNSTRANNQNQFEEVEKIVDDIVKKGIPTNLSLGDFIAKVADTYGINEKEAKTCIRLAMNEMDKGSVLDNSKEDQVYSQCGYYYPSGYNATSSPRAKQDGMDSLSCLGSYNKMMFLR